MPKLSEEERDGAAAKAAIQTDIREAAENLLHRPAAGETAPPSIEL